MPSRMLRLVLAADAAILSCCLALFSAATACALSANCLSALVTLVLAVIIFESSYLIVQRPVCLYKQQHSVCKPCAVIALAVHATYCKVKYTLLHCTAAALQYFGNEALPCANVYSKQSHSPPAVSASNDAVHIGSRKQWYAHENTITAELYTALLQHFRSRRQLK
eukprot:20923-Heterococcus_DN1.PRE.3